MPEWLQLILAAGFGAGLATLLGVRLSKRGADFHATGSVTITGVTWDVTVTQMGPDVAEISLIAAEATKLGEPRIVATSLEVQ